MKIGIIIIIVIVCIAYLLDHYRPSIDIIVTNDNYKVILWYSHIQGDEEIQRKYLNIININY